MFLIPGNVTPPNDKCGDRSRDSGLDINLFSEVEKKYPTSIVQNLFSFVKRFVLAVPITMIITGTNSLQRI